MGLNLNLLPAKNCYHWDLVEIEPIENLENYKNHKRLIVFCEKGLTCAICGQKHGAYIGHYRAPKGDIHIDVYTEDGTMMNRDHIIPRSKGGPNTLKNLQPTCEPCNREKGNGDTVEERKKKQLKAFLHNKKNIFKNDFVKFKDESLVKTDKYLFQILDVAPKSQVFLDGENGKPFKIAKSKLNKFKFKVGDKIQLKAKYDKKNKNQVFDVLELNDYHPTLMYIMIENEDGKLMEVDQDRFKITD